MTIPKGNVIDDAEFHQDEAITLKKTTPNQRSMMIARSRSGMVNTSMINQVAHDYTSIMVLPIYHCHR